jgi:hypothetical protein
LTKPSFLQVGYSVKLEGLAFDGLFRGKFNPEYFHLLGDPDAANKECEHHGHDTYKPFSAHFLLLWSSVIVRWVFYRTAIIESGTDQGFVDVATINPPISSFRQKDFSVPIN